MPRQCYTASKARLASLCFDTTEPDPMTNTERPRLTLTPKTQGTSNHNFEPPWAH